MNFKLQGTQIFLNDKPLRISHAFNLLVDNQKEIERLNEVIESKEKEIEKLIKDNAVLYKEKMKLERDNELIRRFDEGKKMP